jgi:pimeloyl-ACP methyl ester carboxylesterase
MNETPQRTIRVRTGDGVEIAGRATGAGSGVLLVYGAMMEQAGWARLAGQLQDAYTVYTYDRRGRGESSDGPDHSIPAEVEDLRTFVEALPQPLDIFGHSSGALLVLHAVMAGMPVRRLVLYEPVLPAVREPKVPADLPDRIRSHVAAGDRDAAMEAFMRDGMWLTEAEIQRARGSERWRDQLRYVETAADDVHIARSYVLEPERLATVRVPVLLLVGGASPDWMKLGVEKFGEALPDARIEVVEGQGHNAQFSAPDLLAARIRSFLTP